MISKCVGIALMVIGAVMACSIIWPLMMSILVLLWQVVQLGAILFFAYVGYRLWCQKGLSQA